MTVCDRIRPDCEERFSGIRRATEEQDANLRDLAAKLDALPDRIAGQVTAALGAQTVRNADDIQRLFDLIGDLQRAIGDLQIEVARIRGHAGGAGWLITLGVPAATALVASGLTVATTIFTMR